MLAVGCDSFAEPTDQKRPPTQERPVESAPPTSGGSTAPAPVLSLGGAPAFELEPEPDPCAVAAENGAIFCEPGETSGAGLEYCVEAPPDGEPCAILERPPEWAYELLLQCIAHCGVGIASSSRELDGACCYLATSEYYGR